MQGETISTLGTKNDEINKEVEQTSRFQRLFSQPQVKFY